MRSDRSFGKQAKRGGSMSAGERRASGVISTIWTELECLRARWIAARLRSEGFSSTAQDVGPWYDRLQALEEQAPTVAVLWSDGPTAQSR